jgi:hypothetical protein
MMRELIAMRKSIEMREMMERMEMMERIAMMEMREIMEMREMREMMEMMAMKSTQSIKVIERESIESKINQFATQLKILHKYMSKALCVRNLDNCTPLDILTKCIADKQFQDAEKKSEFLRHKGLFTEEDSWDRLSKIIIEKTEKYLSTLRVTSDSPGISMLFSRVEIEKEDPLKLQFQSSTVPFPI